MDKTGRIDRPAPVIFGGGGENTPADREIRYRPYDAAREEKS
ncbi:MAG: hypothetical protein Q4C13_09095 [Clostridia bacterium]|nr:hypothetical protein [Clostridia bacterium]